MLYVPSAALRFVGMGMICRFRMRGQVLGCVYVYGGRDVQVRGQLRRTRLGMNGGVSRWTAKKELIPQCTMSFEHMGVCQVKPARLSST